MADLTTIEAFVLSELAEVPTLQSEISAIESAPTPVAKIQASQVFVDTVFGIVEKYPFTGEVPVTPPVADTHAKINAKAINIANLVTLMQAVLAMLEEFGVLPKPAAA